MSKEPEANLITLNSFTPASPAAIPLGERLEVSVNFERINTNATVLFMRPYKDGRQAANYLAHPPVECTGGRGQVSGWIAFQAPAMVDEVRVTMLDNTERKILHAISYPVDIHWAE